MWSDIVLLSEAPWADTSAGRLSAPREQFSFVTLFGTVFRCTPSFSVLDDAFDTVLHIFTVLVSGVGCLLQLFTVVVGLGDYVVTMETTTACIVTTT